MRKVQHELQDLMSGNTSASTAITSLTKPITGMVPPSTSTESVRSETEKDRSNSNSSTASMILAHNNTQSSTASASMRLFGGTEDVVRDSPHSLTPCNSMMSQIVHLHSDHDLSSTDDEHDHLTASAASSHSGDAASNLEAASSSSASPRHADHSSTLIGTMERIPSDPTIIDPCQDAMVHQISIELYETAHAVAEQLRVSPFCCCFRWASNSDLYK